MCPCGAPATVRLSWEVSSGRGLATVMRRYCPKCADRCAWHVLAEGTFRRGARVYRGRIKAEKVAA